MFFILNRIAISTSQSPSFWIRCGRFFAEHFSNLREILDQKVKGDSRQDSMDDQKANKYGRNQTELFAPEAYREALQFYIPVGLPLNY